MVYLDAMQVRRHAKDIVDPATGNDSGSGMPTALLDLLHHIPANLNCSIYHGPMDTDNAEVWFDTSQTVNLACRGFISSDQRSQLRHGLGINGEVMRG
ncbi:hypothetical protein IWQ60_002987 [Tieghemiomyces parasiticus]|uniref:Uncharacterized protein n=1 Tax=Tieghemiomyces parasiticus TaxID=78921 RepID=A0A9W8E0G6_9FUNG|nr:hypothetical protein IWQ60_002987 [Tieghemiomyces parasiticus]